MTDVRSVRRDWRRMGLSGFTAETNATLLAAQGAPRGRRGRLMNLPSAAPTRPHAVISGGFAGELFPLR